MKLRINILKGILRSRIQGGREDLEAKQIKSDSAVSRAIDYQSLSECESFECVRSTVYTLTLLDHLLTYQTQTASCLFTDIGHTIGGGIS